MVPIVIVELHVATGLDPSHDPGLSLGEGGHQHLSRSPEMWGPVSQDHARRLVDVGGHRVDGGLNFDDGNPFPEAFGFATNALDAAHGPQRQYNSQRAPAIRRGVRHRTGLGLIQRRILLVVAFSADIHRIKESSWGGNKTLKRFNLLNPQATVCSYKPRPLCK